MISNKDKISVKRLHEAAYVFWRSAIGYLYKCETGDMSFRRTDWTQLKRQQAPGL